jgi:isopenicillin-N epimerase
MRDAWRLAPHLTHLDHGAFGAAPDVVLAEQDRWRAILESDPAGFMTEVLGPAVEASRAAIAGFVGADADDVVLVGNVTDGLNAVLRSLCFEGGDEIVSTGLAHGGLQQALSQIAGARVISVAFPCPLVDPGQVVAAVAAAITDKSKLAVLEHVTSPGGAVLPIAEMVAACRARGIPVLVDGAHGPGMLDLDIPSLGADWYVGSCHKWLGAPKGVAMLWAPPARHDALRPAIVASEHARGFHDSFAWSATRDYSAWASLPAAIDFWRALGPAKARARMFALADEAGHTIAARWGTARFAPSSMTAAMVAVRAPVSGGSATDLRSHLRREHGIVATVSTIGGALWVRASFHVYNSEADIDRLADVAF